MPTSIPIPPLLPMQIESTDEVDIPSAQSRSRSPSTELTTEQEQEQQHYVADSQVQPASDDCKAVEQEGNECVQESEDEQGEDKHQQPEEVEEGVGEGVEEKSIGNSDEYEEYYQHFTPNTQDEEIMRSQERYEAEIRLRNQNLDHDYSQQPQ
jgi:hypothetical protein